MTVNGDAVGNSGQVYLISSSYGDYPAGFYVFTSSSSVQFDLTNPYGDSAKWTQMKFVPDYPISGYSKILLNTSSEAPVGTSVTLPPIDSLLGPTGYADPATLSYSSSSGVLSVSPAGAKMYQFSLRDYSTGEALGVITSTNASVTLPQWLRTQLAGKSMKVAIQPLDVNLTLDLVTFSKAMAGSGTATPGMAMATVLPNGDNSKVLQF